MKNKEKYFKIIFKIILLHKLIHLEKYNTINNKYPKITPIYHKRK